MTKRIREPDQWIDRETYAAYLGNKAETQLAFYDRAVESKSMMKASPNWLAFLCLPAWIGYRRQWQMGACIIGLFALLPFIESYFKFSIPGAALLGPFVFFGLQANGYLLLTADGQFHKYQQQGLDTDQIRSLLKDKASASVGLAIGTTIGSFLLLSASAVLADVLIGLP